jgi:hypothetical protein
MTSSSHLAVVPEEVRFEALTRHTHGRMRWRWLCDYDPIKPPSTQISAIVQLIAGLLPAPGPVLASLACCMGAMAWMASPEDPWTAGTGE